MRILLAEDEPSSRRKIERILGTWGWDVICVNDGQEAWQALQGPNPPPVAILNWMMPKMDGLEICRALRGRAGAFTYLILSTSRGSKEDVMAGIAAGVDSYLVKPVDPQDLRIRLVKACEVLDHKGQRAEAVWQTPTEAYEDQVTGLLNRNAIVWRLHDQLGRGNKSGIPVGVVLGSVDGPTEPQDGLLKELGRCLRRRLRAGDFLGSPSRGEFLAIAPGCDSTITTRLAERLFGEAKSLPLEVPVSMTFGTVSAISGASDFMTVLDAANKARRLNRKNGLPYESLPASEVEPALVA